MSYMSTLHAAGIPVEKMAAYLKDHPGVEFDEAVRAIEERHTEEGRGDIGELLERLADGKGEL